MPDTIEQQRRELRLHHCGREERYLIHWLTYADYMQIAQALTELHHRLTYYDGDLEIRSVSAEHERANASLRRLIYGLALELDLDLDCRGSATLCHSDANAGLDPDDCFWITHEFAVRCRDTFDLSDTPPPDLVLEIEITLSLLDRLSILAALNVPEVWRYDGEKIGILILNASGDYVPSKKSKAFPFLPVNELVRFLNMQATMSQTQIARAFREWVRQQVAAGWPQA